MAKSQINYCICKRREYDICMYMEDTWINSNIRIYIHAYSLRNPCICKYITSSRVACVHSGNITYGFSPAQRFMGNTETIFHLKKCFSFCMSPEWFTYNFTIQAHLASNFKSWRAKVLAYMSWDGCLLGFKSHDS